MSETTTTDDERRPLYKNPYLWGFVFGALVLVGIRPLQDAMMKAPPPIAVVGDWSLIDHTGKPFGANDLKGKVWVASFIFTRCPTLCPRITAEMKRVHEKFEQFGDDAYLISITVDPENDKPDVLRAYMDKNGIDGKRWSFLTGDREELELLIIDKMKLAMGNKEALATNTEGEISLYDISHTGRLALFDQNGDLRATFTADDEGLAALGNAARLLIRKGPNP